MTCILIAFLIGITILLLDVIKTDRIYDEAFEQFKACVDEGKTASFNVEVKEFPVVECK